MANAFHHTTKNISRTKDEKLQEYYDIRSYLLEDMKNEPTKHPGTLLLDSSLISATNYKYRTIKIIQCGDYYQVYHYKDSQLVSDKDVEELNDKNYDVNLFTPSPEEEDIKITDTDFLHKKENSSRQNELKFIEYKNIQRSKFELQRLVKSNEDIFKTFITLTFAENITSVEQANKKFAIWRTKIKSIFKEFSYICVPEFQKRGAIHYHLLTNIEINKLYNNIELIYNQENSNNIIEHFKYKNQYDVKYWSYGFSSVFPMKDINVVGYLSKYMTKDIDNRLWGKRRYLYSMNLKRPSVMYIDLIRDQDFFTYLDVINKCDINYSKSYKTTMGSDIEFTEYKKSEE